MKFKKTAVLGGLLAGLIGVNALPASAQVEQCTAPQPTSCVALNTGGSSAATPFMTQVPLNMLDQTPNLPIHYVNGNITSPVTITAGKLHVWTGTRAGVPTIFRYSATGSSDGVLKLQNPTSDSRSLMHYLDHLASTCSSGPTLLTRAADGKQYYEYTGCNTIIAGDLPMTMGMADVAGSSFHQVGPVTTVVKPLDQSMLTSAQAAIVPWQLLVGEHVKKNVGGVLQPVVGLNRTEIEAIFSRNVTDWTQVGLVTDVTTPGTPDASSPITLCLRAAGSGSKAAFDETVMKDATETPSGSTNLTLSADGVYFGSSTQDVQDCIRGNAGLSRPAHPRGIGYVDADVSVATAPGYPIKLDGLRASNIVVSSKSTSVATSTTLDDTAQDWVTNSLVNYSVKITGGTGAGQTATVTANAATQLTVAPAWATNPDTTSTYQIWTNLVDDPKATVKCGEYIYWAGERLNTRNYSDPGISSDQIALASDFVTNSSSSSTIALLPAGDFWVAGADMYTFKNADAGPVSFKPGAHPCAQ
ncbi:MAG TPA: hypothetical protein VMN77_08490 [Nitrospiria bacterium]|jgi:ABC-type phosphate transport system substrate-binding protein|nr:hypothetical protein [Nitrospiria bacterium]